MAKHVLLTFTSDADADAFVEAVQRTEGLEGDDPENRHPGIFYCVTHAILPGQYSVVSPRDTVAVRGVFKQPTQYCECPGKVDSKSVRGSKFGWWVCATCHKPRRGLHQTPRNLLVPDERVSERTVTLSVVEGASKPHYLKD